MPASTQILPSEFLVMKWTANFLPSLIKLWFCGQKGLILEVTELICDCYCSLTLPHGAVGWSAVCECGISWSYSLFFTLSHIEKTLKQSFCLKPLGHVW